MIEWPLNSSHSSRFSLLFNKTTIKTIDIESLVDCSELLRVFLSEILKDFHKRPSGSIVELLNHPWFQDGDPFIRSIPIPSLQSAHEQPSYDHVGSAESKSNKKAVMYELGLQDICRVDSFVCSGSDDETLYSFASIYSWWYHSRPSWFYVMEKVLKSESKDDMWSRWLEVVRRCHKLNSSKSWCANNGEVSGHSKRWCLGTPPRHFLLYFDRYCTWLALSSMSTFASNKGTLLTPQVSWRMNR